MPADDPTLHRFQRGCHFLSALSRLILEKGYLKVAGIRGLSFTQINLLKFLDSRIPRSIGDVMRFSGASFPAASKMVQRLKNKGLVKAGANPADTRARILAVTPAGRKAVERYSRVKIDRLRKLLHDCADKEVDRFSASLEAIAALFLKETDLLSDLCMQCGAYSDQCMMASRPCRVKAR